MFIQVDRLLQAETRHCRSLACLRPKDYQTHNPVRGVIILANQNIVFLIPARLVSSRCRHVQEAVTRHCRSLACLRPKDYQTHNPVRLPAEGRGVIIVEN